MVTRPPLGRSTSRKRLRFRQGDLALNGFSPHKGLERRVSGARHGGRAHGPAGMAGFAGLARGARFGRARLGDTAGEIQPVHLADNGVARDPHAQAGRNLAGAVALGPELLEKLHTLVRPGHLFVADNLCWHVVQFESPI